MLPLPNNIKASVFLLLVLLGGTGCSTQQAKPIDPICPDDKARVAAIRKALNYTREELDGYYVYKFPLRDSFDGREYQVMAMTEAYFKRSDNGLGVFDADGRMVEVKGVFFMESPWHIVSVRGPNDSILVRQVTELGPGAHAYAFAVWMLYKQRLWEVTSCTAEVDYQGKREAKGESALFLFNTKDKQRGLKVFYSYEDIEKEFLLGKDENGAEVTIGEKIKSSESSYSTEILIFDPKINRFVSVIKKENTNDVINDLIRIAGARDTKMENISDLQKLFESKPKKVSFKDKEEEQ